MRNVQYNYLAGNQSASWSLRMRDIITKSANNCGLCTMDAWGNGVSLRPVYVSV